MIRLLHHAAFAAGAAAVAWVGAGYVGSNLAALPLVLLIGAFFGAGAIELRRFRQATASLEHALASTETTPTDLDAWMSELDPTLRSAVRLRVEGDRVALPGPALTPYLAGLLVLLGMLGTFVGMIVTLKGTGLALENAADVETIRSTLAAPVKGLGQAFGTSVAGVAASAMLGLMTALARRERQAAAHALDARIATTLRPFTRARQDEQQRQESQRLLRTQAEAMPALVAQLQALAAQMSEQQLAQHERQLASQAAFHGEAQRAYAALAESVDRSLKASLAESARLAGAAIQPAVQSTMAALSRETAAQREALGAAVQQQLAGTTARLEATMAALTERWQTTLSEANAAAAERERERIGAFDRSLATMTQTQQHELRQTATAMATVVGELRAALSDGLVRDNAVLDERNRLLATLATLLDSVNHASSEQRAAIDALLQASADVLARTHTQFAATVAAEASTLQSAAGQLGGSAAQIASLGEGFGLAVQRFSQASEQTTAQLQRIEAALGHSLARSDEQLAYYVAQAREIVELTLGSQKAIVDDLRRIARAEAA